METHTFNPDSQKTETGRSLWAQGQSDLSIKLRPSLFRLYGTMGLNFFLYWIVASSYYCVSILAFLSTYLLWKQGLCSCCCLSIFHFLFDPARRIGVTSNRVHLKNGSLLQSISQSSEHFSFLMPTFRIFIIRLGLNTEVFEQIHLPTKSQALALPRAQHIVGMHYHLQNEWKNPAASLFYIEPLSFQK